MKEPKTAITSSVPELLVCARDAYIKLEKTDLRSPISEVPHYYVENAGSLTEIERRNVGGTKFIRVFVGYLCGKFMSISKVDQRHRIVVDKRIRKKTNIRAGDVVILEPLDDHSFKVDVLNFTPENLENDPAWEAIHTPIKVKKYVQPEKLEEIMEEKAWQQ